MTLRVALLADDRQQLNHLSYILRELDIIIIATYVDLDYNWQEKDIEFWLIVSHKADQYAQLLSDITSIPLFFTDQIPNRDDTLLYKRWCLSLVDKIGQLTGLKIISDKVSLGEVPDIWFLAASLGGPEAIKVFFSAIEADLPVSFIYGQHIEHNMLENLINIIENNSHYKAQSVLSGQRLESGKVHIIPANQATRVTKGERLWVGNEPWEAPYTPNLNQIMSSIPENYLSRLGIIIFSGMCDDGIEKAVHLAKRNVPLWVQTPADCICASMPEAALASGKVSYSGSPLQLAEALNQRYNR